MCQYKYVNCAVSATIRHAYSELIISPGMLSQLYSSWSIYRADINMGRTTVIHIRYGDAVEAVLVSRNGDTNTIGRRDKIHSPSPLKRSYSVALTREHGMLVLSDLRPKTAKLASEIHLYSPFHATCYLTY